MSPATRRSAGLTPIDQRNFSAGIVRATSRELIPDSGVYEAQNVLVSPEDGSAYKRGGTGYLSTSSFASTGLRALYDLYLSAGQRTFFADQSAFGVLDAAEAPITLGGGGMANPRQAAVIGGVAVIGGGKLYAGSRKTADYSTGTASTTVGSKTVTGAGTTWNTLVDAGMLFRVGAERYYPVASIDSPTQITLADAYEGTTGAGKAYALNVTGSAPRTSDYYVAVGDRLISLEGNKAYISRGRSSGSPGLPPAGQLQWQTFDLDSYQQVPDGVSILGGVAIRDNLLIFTTGGIYLLNNLALDITDDAGNTQQSLQNANPDLILWGNEGIAASGNSSVVPATDGVYLVDGVGNPEPIARSIQPVISSYVRSGYKPGLAAVYRSHYFLPVLDSANVLQDLLVCRLDRPIKTDIGTVWPWTRFAGSGANVVGFAVRVGSTQRTPKLLAGSRQDKGRVLDASTYFEPSAAYKQDHDGAAFTWDLISRDFVTGDGFNRNTTRLARIRYVLTDAGTDDPTISAYYSTGIEATDTPKWGTAVWNAFTWVDSSVADDVPLSGSAPENDGAKPYAWPVNAHSRFIRLHLRSASPASKLVLRQIELEVSQSAGDH